tara:strand:+ start:33832 stop:34314 length:483 start_codon:yes stop_codon:yes gene_type:complete
MAAVAILARTNGAAAVLPKHLSRHSYCATRKLASAKISEAGADQDHILAKTPAARVITLCLHRQLQFRAAMSPTAKAIRQALKTKRTQLLNPLGDTAIATAQALKKAAALLPMVAEASTQKTATATPANILSAGQRIKMRPTLLIAKASMPTAAQPAMPA